MNKKLILTLILVIFISLMTLVILFFNPFNKVLSFQKTDVVSSELTGLPQDLKDKFVFLSEEKQGVLSELEMYKQIADYAFGNAKTGGIKLTLKDKREVYISLLAKDIVELHIFKDGKSLTEGTYKAPQTARLMEQINIRIKKEYDKILDRG